MSESSQNGAEAEGEGSRDARWIWGLRALGLAIALLVYMLLGGAEGLSEEARRVAAVGALMAVWWMTEALPLSATALLPIVLLPALAGIAVGDATAPYASSVVFLFLGGFLIAIAMEKWNLHTRIALMTLSRVGVSPSRIVLGLMLATGFLSMWVSNTATTLMMLPIGISILSLVVDRSSDQDSGEVDEVGEGKTVSEAVSDPEIRRFGICLVLAIAWSASMGGLGTLLGSPPNAIVAGYAADELGRDIGFLNWMMVGFPLALVFILIGWVLMTQVLYRFSLDEIPGGQAMIEERLRGLGTLSQGEKMVLVVFCSAAFLWIVPGLLFEIPGLGDAAPWLDSLDDTAIAIAAGIALFLLPGEGRNRMVLQWSDAEDGLPWGVLLLFGGGLSLAGAVAETGLDGWMGDQVQGLGGLPMLALVAAVVTIVLFLTEITSNTATAATFIPILGGVAIGLDVDALTLLIPAAFAATCAFMLPVGTPPNAIVFGTGAVTIGQMARGGAVLNVVGIVLVTAFAYMLGGIALGLEF